MLNSQAPEFKIAMLIDDNSIDNFVKERLLQKEKFAEKIIICENAKDALEYLKESKNNSDLIPDVIFLDINMPGMSGFDFLKEFEEIDDTIKMKCPIVVLSSSINENDFQRAIIDPYVKFYFDKPFTPDKLNRLKDDLLKDK